MLLVKLHLNSINSTGDAQFVTIYIGNFYLFTLLKWSKYIQLRLFLITKKSSRNIGCWIKLHKMFFYMEVQNGLRSLLQAGILAQELLTNML